MAKSDTSTTAEIRRVLSLEARALARAASAVDGRWAKAVDKLAACRGKVVLTGVGKSGLVAQKIAATSANPVRVRSMEAVAYTTPIALASLRSWRSAVMETLYSAALVVSGLTQAMRSRWSRKLQ